MTLVQPALRLVVNCGELKTDTPLQCGLRAPHHGIRGKIVVGLVLRICTYFRNLKFVFSVLICSSSVFCILALGSGQRLLYRVGSGLGLVLVLVLRFCAYSDGGVYSYNVSQNCNELCTVYCRLHNVGSTQA